MHVHVAWGAERRLRYCPGPVSVIFRQSDLICPNVEGQKTVMIADRLCSLSLRDVTLKATNRAKMLGDDSPTGSHH